jgi:hypothetical protein
VKPFVSLQFLNPIQSHWNSLDGGSAHRKAATEHKQNKHKQTSMPRLGFEPTIPVFERANTFHALDRAATVIGNSFVITYINTYTLVYTCITHILIVLFIVRNLHIKIF